MSVREYKIRGRIIENSWVVDWSPAPGERKRVMVEGSKAYALEVESELRKASRRSPVSNPRLQDVWDDYLDDLKLHRSKLTVRDAILTWEKLKPFVGSKPVNFLSQQDINNIKKTYSETPAQCNKFLKRLTAFVSWLVERGMAEPLPFKVKMLPYTRPLIQVPTQSEFERFMAHFKGIKRAAVLLLGESGLRVTECLSLRWEDVNLSNGVIVLRHKTKRNKHRLAFMSDEAIELLTPHRKKFGYIFENPKTKKPMTTMHTSFKTACRKAGLDERAITHHRLRHFFATSLIHNGVDLHSVKELLGHTDITTTQVYLHSTATRLQEYVKRVSDRRRQ